MRQVIRIHIEQLGIHIDQQQLEKAHRQHDIDNDFQQTVGIFLVTEIAPKKIEEHQDDNVAETLGIERTAQQGQQQQIRGDQGQDRHERQFDAAQQQHGTSDVDAQLGKRHQRRRCPEEMRVHKAQHGLVNRGGDQDGQQQMALVALLASVGQAGVGGAGVESHACFIIG